ncbi:group III truncated hemoglobin [Sphingopyxis witflariensis]|uniref:Preprotein translocase subunit TatC n=1 Tax=Sphingopyxis witflariensis TaxID=173675 RepID=A0A246JNK9_9SPHN|nr:group III truncated hemoglobin [Sphingopyxis witflariensis]OWQ94165.1 preprotein translocase subunit TatC [Sphingopyxis witflariensis]
MNDNSDIDEASLARLIPIFYDRVRADAELGPLFNAAVNDWAEHLERLTAFWSSVMLTTGRYKGSPMAAHLKHKAHITPALFDRWLALWSEVTDEVMPSAAAAALQAKAARIAESLQLALFFRLDDPVGDAVRRTA